MLNSYKYKVGDYVLLYEDLSIKRRIRAKYEDYGSNRYVLDNDVIVTEYDITFYYAPIARLAIKNKELKKNIAQIAENFNVLEKKINEKVFKPEDKISSMWGKIMMSSFFSYPGEKSEPEKPQIPTLEERIEQLEAKKVKKVSKKKNKKSKK